MNDGFRFLNLPRWLTLVGLGMIAWAVLAPSALGHQVPNLTIETHFAADQHYRITVNLDPRVFLSEQPTSLPPLPASWYANLPPDGRDEMQKKAQAYLEKNLTLHFGDPPSAFPSCTLEPVDGATAGPVTPETTEVHLLASAQSKIIAGAQSFHLDFGQDAKVSLILLNASTDTPERRPEVLFPGETSRPYPLPRSVPSTATAPVITDNKTSPLTMRWIPWAIGSAVALLFFGWFKFRQR